MGPSFQGRIHYRGALSECSTPLPLGSELASHDMVGCLLLHQSTWPNCIQLERHLLPIHHRLAEVVSTFSVYGQTIATTRYVVNKIVQRARQGSSCAVAPKQEDDTTSAVDGLQRGLHEKQPLRGRGREGRRRILHYAPTSLEKEGVFMEKEERQRRRR